VRGRKEKRAERKDPFFSLSSFLSVLLKVRWI